MGTSTVLKPLRSMRWFSSTSTPKHFDFTFQFLRMSAQITLNPVRGAFKVEFEADCGFIFCCNKLIKLLCLYCF
jgi:hypothetical protein